MNKKHIGDCFEQAASQHLQQKGLKLLDNQARFNTGELDLVMQDKTCLVFVEVRFRKNKDFGGAALSITAAKKRRLQNAALLWLTQQGYKISHTEFRFDVVAFEGSEKSVNWIQNIIIEG